MQQQQQQITKSLNRRRGILGGYAREQRENKLTRTNGEIRTGEKRIFSIPNFFTFVFACLSLAFISFVLFSPNEELLHYAYAHTHRQTDIRTHYHSHLVCTRQVYSWRQNEEIETSKTEKWRKRERERERGKYEEKSRLN